MRLKLALYVLLHLLLFCTALQAKVLQGRVTHVSDGDTLWLEVSKSAKPIKVRLQGMDAPEICQPWGEQARDALKGKLLRQQVSLNTRAKDDYNRALGRVEFQGADVGQWLVSQGHAWSYHHRRDPGPYISEQRIAEGKRLGLWAQTGADARIEPRQWRKTRGACKS